MTREQQLIESYLKSHKPTKCRAICKPKPITKSKCCKSTSVTSSICIVHKSSEPVISKHKPLDNTDAIQSKLLAELEEFNANFKQRRADAVAIIRINYGS